MRQKLRSILITGGAGFIGSAFVRLLYGSSRGGFGSTGRSRGLNLCYGSAIVIDSLTYAGDLKRLAGVKGRYKFYKADICDKGKIAGIFKKERPDIVVHFAAESHVDRSIQNAAPFIETNIKGTQVLLEASREFKVKRFIHISTDEVYGEIANGKFKESSAFRPNSPYAASKAAADLLVQAYIRTYGLPAIIVRPCNNYGPWQYPEKLIPVAISCALKRKKVPVYARGENVREWLYVDDCARGINEILKKGKTGEIYNLGSGSECKNINTVKLLLKNMGASPDCYKFVKDRPGHDIRYCLDSTKVRKATGWKPAVGFSKGIELTVEWYLGNIGWLNNK